MFQNMMSTAKHHQTRAASPPHNQKKRLIVCCDGTWMNSDKGWDKGKPQPPSNVTRLARSFKRGCSDGNVQIVNYQSGVGTGEKDAVAGGAFGGGIAEVGMPPAWPSWFQADAPYSTFARVTLSSVPTTSMVTRSS